MFIVSVRLMQKKISKMWHVVEPVHFSICLDGFSWRKRDEREYSLYWEQCSYIGHVEL